MNDSQQELGGSSVPASAGLTTTRSNKSRQVPARYLQPKTTVSASQGGAVLNSSRASLTGAASTGWLDAQHAHQDATPMVARMGSMHTGACSTAGNGKARIGITPFHASAAAKGRSAHNNTINAAFTTPAPSAASVPSSGIADRTRHQALKTPRNLSASAVVPRPVPPPGKQAVMSTQLRGAVAVKGRPADDGMRAKLSAWKELKQQSVRTTAKPEVEEASWKEPAPKNTLFRATAATRIQKDSSTGRRPAASSAGVGKAASTEKGGSSNSSNALAGPGLPRGTGTSASTRPTASAVSAAVEDASSASPSAFTATMATLQGSGGKPRVTPKHSSSKASRPSPVPLLRLEQACVSSAMQDTALPPQQHLHQQHVNMAGQSLMSTEVPQSATKIPKLNLSGLTAQVQPSAGQLNSARVQPMPSSSRWPAGEAEAAAPDAAPRSVRDALPGRVLCTPHTSRASAARQQHTARRASTPETSDMQAKQLDTPSKAITGRQNNSPFTVPKLKLGAVHHPVVPLPQPAAGMDRQLATAHSCLAGQGEGVAGRAPSAVAAPSMLGVATPNRVSFGGAGAATAPGMQQPNWTPKEPLASSRLRTPRISHSSAPPSGTSALPTTRRPERAKADDVRQQLRLLRMQQLQLRHINAGAEAALLAKREKIHAAAASAAAAIVDLSSQLLQLRDQSQQEALHSKLRSVLQQQEEKLQLWADAQAHHQANLQQLQAACTSALSHIPLLNGATVGGNPDSPDLQTLQQQLHHGRQLLAELQPAMQLLLTGAAADDSSATAAATISAVSTKGTGSRDLQDTQLQAKGIQDTAALSKELLKVAAEECTLLQQLTRQLSELSDMQLYVNSMQVQLQYLRQPNLEVADGLAC